MSRYKLLGKLAKHTFRYRVKKPNRHKGKYTGWADLMYKCDDGRWRKVKRYATIEVAYEALIRKIGYGFILEK